MSLIISTLFTKKNKILKKEKRKTGVEREKEREREREIHYR